MALRLGMFTMKERAGRPKETRLYGCGAKRLRQLHHIQKGQWCVSGAETRVVR